MAINISSTGSAADASAAAAAAAAAEAAASAADAAELVAAIDSPTALTRDKYVPMFARLDALAIDLSRDGEVVELTSVSDQARADNASGRFVPAFADWDATLVVLSHDDELIDITVTADDGTTTTGSSADVPAFGDPDASAIDLSDEGICEITIGQLTRDADSYSARSGYVPAQDADATSKIAYYDPDQIILIFVIWGQSKAYGINVDGEAMLSTSAVYPGKALMPSFGVHIDGRRFSEVADLVESDNGSARETSASALTNHFIQYMEAATGAQPTVLTFIAAHTAQEYTNLNRGSQYYKDLINGLKDARRYAESVGKIPICPAVFTNHGQNTTDKFRHPDHYIAAMLQFQRNVTADIRSILEQGEDPVIIMTQIDAGLQRDPGSSTFFTRGPPFAQLKLAEASPNFRIAANEGSFQLGTDGLHCTCEGYYRQGMAWARAAFAEIGGTGWHPQRITNAIWRSTTVLDLEFNVPLDMADQSTPDGEIDVDSGSGGMVTAYDAGVDQIAGLQLADSSGLIAKTGYSLSISDAGQASITDRFLRVTFTGAPTKFVTWAIAMRTDTSGIGRTLLSTTAAYTPIHTLPSGLDDRDFCLASYGTTPAPT